MALWLFSPKPLSSQEPGWQSWSTSCLFLPCSSRYLIVTSPWTLETTAELAWTPHGTVQGHSRKNNTGKGQWGRQRDLGIFEEEASIGNRTVLSHHITQFITTKSKNQLLLPRTKHFTISRYWPKEVLKTASKSSNFRASMPFCPPEVIKSTEQKSINLSQSTGNAWQTARTRSPGPGERCFTEDALAYDSI